MLLILRVDGVRLVIGHLRLLGEDGIVLEILRIMVLVGLRFLTHRVGCVLPQESSREMEGIQGLKDSEGSGGGRGE